MKRRKNPCPWWKGHAWHRPRLAGFLAMSETCSRCGLIKVFDGVMDEYHYYEPKDPTR